MSFQKQAFIHAVLVACFVVCLVRNSKNQTDTHHYVLRQPRQNNTRQYKTINIILYINITYNLFRYNNKCISIAFDTQILSNMGHHYSTLKTVLKDQMVVIICIFWSFCTVMMKEKLDIRVLFC